MLTRDDVHRLVDTLPESDLEIAARVLEGLHLSSDPVLAALARADAGEPDTLTDEERVALHEGLDEIERGEVVPHAEIRREIESATQAHRQ